MIRPSRVISEDLVITVSSGSKLQTLKDFTDALTAIPARPVVGGFRGGSDHMLAALVAADNDCSAATGYPLTPSAD